MAGAADGLCSPSALRRRQIRLGQQAKLARAAYRGRTCDAKYAEAVAWRAIGRVTFRNGGRLRLSPLA